MDYQHIQVAVEDTIGRITLRRPERFNALSLELLQEAIDALGAVSADPTVKVIIIDGDGRAFSVGHDLNEMIDRERSFFDELFTTCTVMMEKIQGIPQPVIAQVHGMADGAAVPCHRAETGPRDASHR
jgi:enoyl-CoA hydratase/carnithine racemase